MAQDGWDHLFTEVGGLMTIDTVTVHDSDDPHALHSTQVFLDAVTVLVDLPHLRDEACA